MPFSHIIISMPFNIGYLRKNLEKSCFSARIKISETRDVDGKDFHRAMDIYKKSFPPEELASDELMAGIVKSDPNYHLFVAKKGKDVIGMATARVFPNFVLGCYMATDPSYRNLGLGKKIFNFWKKRFRNNIKGPLGLIGEVELEGGLSPDNDAAAKRRISYYRREIKARVLQGVEYEQPSYSGGEPVKMGLIAFFQEKPRRIKGSDIRDAAKAIYTEIYRLKPDDPLVKALDKIPEEVKLE